MNSKMNYVLDNKNPLLAVLFAQCIFKKTFTIFGCIKIHIPSGWLSFFTLPGLSPLLLESFIQSIPFPLILCMHVDIYIGLKHFPSLYNDPVIHRTPSSKLEVFKPPWDAEPISLKK